MTGTKTYVTGTQGFEALRIPHTSLLTRTKEHAPEVLSLAGVPSGTRYAALNPASASPHLITYEFPDLAFSADPRFVAVANQELSRGLVERIYAHVSFDIRFYSEFAPPAYIAQDGSVAEPALLASIAFSPVRGKEGDFALWFAGNLILELKGLEGVVRVRRFKFVNGVVRERNVVSVPGAPKWLALVELENGGGDVRGKLEGVLERAGLAEVDVGWYEVQRMFKESEWGGVGVVPVP